MNFIIEKITKKNRTTFYQLMVKSGHYFIPVIFYHKNRPFSLKFNTEIEATSFYFEHENSISSFFMKNKSQKIIYVPSHNGTNAHFQILIKKFLFWKPKIRSHPITGDYADRFESFDEAYSSLNNKSLN